MPTTMVQPIKMARHLILHLLLPSVLYSTILAFQSDLFIQQRAVRYHPTARWASTEISLCSNEQSTDNTHELLSSTTSSSNFTKYRIQPATYSQLPQIASIMTSSFHPELDTNWFLRPIRVLLETDRLQSNFPYGDKNHDYLVILHSNNDEDMIVGFCDLDFRHPPNDTANPLPLFSSNAIRQRPYLSDLIIHPNHRRKGLGTYLMNEVKLRVRSRGTTEIYLCVAEENVGALQMYERLGYKVLDYLDGRRGLGVDGGVRLLCLGI